MKKFKSEKAELTGATSEEKNILIASLLIECAKEDGDFSDDEIIKIKSLLNTKLILIVMMLTLYLMPH